MAANILPPLSVGGDSSNFVRKQPPRGPALTSRSKPAAPRGYGGRRGGGGGGESVRGWGREQKERDQAKLLLEEVDPSSYRKSILHNICTDMLEKGFHQSFAELFTLIEQQRAEHERAGPAAILLEPLIDRDHTKLEQLKVQLTTVEDARRAGDLEAVYMALRSLAQYFERSGDTWLSDHFYQRCLETGVQIKGDNQRKEGEAHCHVGLALENRGSLHKAASHLETFHQLSQRHNWHTESGESLHEIACQHLRRVYTAIAAQAHKESPPTAITYLKKALEMAREGGDSYQEGLACYRLGKAFEGTGDPDTAIQYHKGYLERCKYHNDDAGVGNAYEALSRSYESKGDLENAVKYLELYVGVTEKAGLQSSLAKACSAIGTMHNTLGDYDKAVEYFGRCYTICSKLDDKEALHSARVQFGIAKGHQFMRNYSSYVNELPGSSSIERLLAWKDARVFPNSSTLADDERDNERESSSHSESETGDVTTDSQVAGAGVDGSEQVDSSDTAAEGNH